MITCFIGVVICIALVHSVTARNIPPCSEVHTIYFELHSIDLISGTCDTTAHGDTAAQCDWWFYSTIVDVQNKPTRSLFFANKVNENSLSPVKSGKSMNFTLEYNENDVNLTLVILLMEEDASDSIERLKDPLRIVFEKFLIDKSFSTEFDIGCIWEKRYTFGTVNSINITVDKFNEASASCSTTDDESGADVVIEFKFLIDIKRIDCPIGGMSTFEPALVTSYPILSTHEKGVMTSSNTTKGTMGQTNHRSLYTMLTIGYIIVVFVLPMEIILCFKMFEIIIEFPWCQVKLEGVKGMKADALPAPHRSESMGSDDKNQIRPNEVSVTMSAPKTISGDINT